jgi:hypothetical protein
MLSKLTPFLVGSTFGMNMSDFSSQVMEDRQQMRHIKHPEVRAGNCQDALYAVRRLKEGPENIPQVIN